MKTIPIACVLWLAALSLAACKGDAPPPKPGTATEAAKPVANEYSMPAPAEAPAEAKKEEARPLPPAAPTAAPAEGVKK